MTRQGKSLSTRHAITFRSRDHLMGIRLPKPVPALQGARA
jgi:hypothetical protein